MEYSTYYDTKLYPLQDEVLKKLKSLGQPFYLTGGTAVSRGYFHHRYSDDLDLFANNTDGFLDIEKTLLRQSPLICLLNQTIPSVRMGEGSHDCVPKIIRRASFSSVGSSILLPKMAPFLTVGWAAWRAASPAGANPRRRSLP